MPLQVRESFQIHAPIDRVWAYLTDPRRVVTCLPGAELISVEDATTYRGRVKVKVGPVTAAYEGKVIMLERDEATHVVRMRGEGREASGAGSASMTMTSTLMSLPEGTTQVEVTADVDVVGRIMQFGRGMIESVNKQLFKQFTACLTDVLEQSSDAAPPLSSAGGPLPLNTEHPSIAARPVRLLSVLWHAWLDWLREVFHRKGSASARPNR